MNKYKFLIPVSFSILVGFLIGGIFFTKYDNTVDASYTGNLVYFLEINTHPIDSDISSFSSSLLLEEDNLYHEYIGITKSLENAEKIKELYEQTGNNINVKEKIIDNSKFLELLKEYDNIFLSFNSLEDIKAIENVVIDNFKEMMNTDNN